MARIQDLALYLSNKHKISKKEAERFLTTVVDVLNDALHYEKQAKVKGLGTFKVIEVKDRESVNVNTGERIVIEGRPKITFTADAVMKELVNKPFAQFDTVALNDGVTFDDMPEEVDVADEENVEPTAAETIVEEAVQEPAETEPQPELEQLMDDAVPEEQAEEELEEEMPAEEPVAPVAETEAVAGPVEETPAQEEIPVIVEEVAPVVAEEVRSALVEEPEQPKADAEPEQKEPEQQPIAEETEPAEDQQTEEVGEETPAMAAVMEKETQPEAEKLPEPEPEEMPASEPEETEEPAEPKSSKAWLWWLFGSLLFGAIMYFAGYQMGSKSKEAPAEAEKPAAVVPDTVEKVDSAEIKAALEAEKAAKAKADSIAVAKAAEEAEAAKKAAYEAEVAKQQAEEAAGEDNNPKALNNARNIVRTGAYNIVGTQQTVVVRKGQTLEKVSKAYLGPGMEVYVMVHNGVTVAKEGSTLKIPKLEVKKKR